MSGATLLNRSIFGLKQDVADNLYYIEDHLIAYPAGHNVVIYNTEEKKQKVINGSDSSDGITALSICPSKRFIAIAEKGERAMINIYDLKTLKKRKVLTTSDCQSKQFISLTFSADNQLLLTQGGAPDYALICWNWSKAKSLASIKCNSSTGNTSGSGGCPPQYVTQCSFSNIDPAIVCVTGNTMLKYYRIVDSAFRPMPAPRVDLRFFKCHVWLKQKEDEVLVGTSLGDLLLFSAGEFVTRITASPGDGKSIETLVCTRKGIVAGCDDSSIFLFEYIEDASVSPSESIVLSRSVKIDESSDQQQNAGGSSATSSSSVATNAIRSIAVSPSEETLVVSLSNSQLLTLPYQMGDMLKQNEIDPVVTHFHRPGESAGETGVTGMDVCIRKPLVVTSGVDRTVRLWNYQEGTCEMLKQFTEDVYSVSMHPSGLHLLIGFADKLRLMNVSMDDIRLFKEFSVKGCREVQFSNGGHLFAAVNGNTIQIFSTYTGEMQSNFRGHNGKVKSLYWSANDAVVISAGLDGAIYGWDIEESKRDGEFVQKGVLYSTGICNHGGSAVFTAGSDRLLKEIEFPSSLIAKEIETDKTIGQLVLSHSQRILIAGTAEADKPGAVRVYKFPLTGDYVEYACLSAPISRMCVSFDDTKLFVAGEDGTLCIFDIREKETRSRLRDGKGDNAGFSEEILVTKSDLEEKTAYMQELKSKVDELTLHNEYQMRLKDMNYNENIKDVTEKFTNELEQDKNKYEVLREEKNDMEMDFEEKIKQLDEKHQQKLHEIEASYQQKIMKEVEAYQTVVSQRDMQGTRWRNEQMELINTHEKYVSEVTEDFEQRLDEDKQLRIQMGEEKQQVLQEQAETRRQLEEDIDREIEDLRMKFENKLAVEREATLRYKGENGIMKKKFSALQKDIEDQREDVKTLLEKEKDLYEHIKALEKEIQAHKKEIRSRDETIGDKEKRIYDLKKKNQELEKFKFVLDYKIKELKRQIEPRENEISDMRDQIKEMDQELEQFHKSNAQLDLLIGELRNRIDGMQKEINVHRKRLGDQSSLVRRFRCDLHEITQFIQDPAALKEKCAALSNKYVKINLGGDKLDHNVDDEYARQREFLEKSLATLKKKYAADVDQNNSETVRIMGDNMGLIKEINELRASLNNLKGNVQTAQATLGIHMQHMAKNNKKAAPEEDPEEIVQRQAEHVAKLEKSIRLLENQFAASAASENGKILPPVQRIDG